MKERCPDPRDLLALAGGAPGARAQDGRWAHAQSCPRCQSLFAAHAAFARAPSWDESAPGEDAVAERIGAAIERAVLASGDGGRGAPIRRTVPLRRSLWPRLFVPALGAAAIVVAAVLVLEETRPQHGGPSALREGSPTLAAHPGVLPLPVRRLEDGRIELAWRRHPSADGYRVRILDAGFEELQCLATGADTSVIFDPTEDALRLYWVVEAYEGGDRIASSVACRLGPEG